MRPPIPEKPYMSQGHDLQPYPKGTGGLHQPRGVCALSEGGGEASCFTLLLTLKRELEIAIFYEMTLHVYTIIPSIKP